MSYKVDLEVFAGPLDLLLYLIRKEEVEIHEVEIAKICEQYLAYLRMLRSLEIDVSADFLVLASTLVMIKARKMLPGEEVDLEEELNPEDDLIKQLLEYKKYKTLARELESRAVNRRRMLGVKGRERAGDVPLEEVGIFDLFSAFSRLVQETGLGQTAIHLKGDKPIREYVRELTDRLRSAQRLLFRDLFAGPHRRGDLIGMFVALLELIKLQVVRAFQDHPFGEIEVALIGDPDVALTLYDAELAWDDSTPGAEPPAAGDGGPPADDLPPAGGDDPGGVDSTVTEALAADEAATPDRSSSESRGPEEPPAASPPPAPDAGV